MSDLSKSRECAEWLNAWLEHAKDDHGASALKHVKRALAEQTANCDNVANRRSETYAADYRKSVSQIADAIPVFEEIAADQSKAREDREAKIAAENVAYRAMLVQKYPRYR